MFTPLFIGGLGPVELFVILALVVLLFGAQKLPELARASGEAMGEFAKGRQEIEDEIRRASDPVAEQSVETSEDVETESSAKPA